MEVIPAVDVLDGRVVRLLGGDFDEVTVYAADPYEIVAGWAASGARREGLERVSDRRRSLRRWLRSECVFRLEAVSEPQQ